MSKLRPLAENDIVSVNDSGLQGFVKAITKGGRGAPWVYHVRFETGATNDYHRGELTKVRDASTTLRERLFGRPQPAPVQPAVEAAPEQIAQVAPAASRTTVAPVDEDVLALVDDSIVFEPNALDAVEQFSDSKPFKGTVEERIEKFKLVHTRLCDAYNRPTELEIDPLIEQIAGADSGYSHYDGLRETIVLSGKLSVVTYLFLFAVMLNTRQSIDAGEVVEPMRWSATMFSKYFPRSFRKLELRGGMLVRKFQAQLN